MDKQQSASTFWQNRAESFIRVDRKAKRAQRLRSCLTPSSPRFGGGQSNNLLLKPQNAVCEMWSADEREGRLQRHQFISSLIDLNVLNLLHINKSQYKTWLTLHMRVTLARYYCTTLSDAVPSWEWVTANKTAQQTSSNRSTFQRFYPDTDWVALTTVLEDGVSFCSAFGVMLRGILLHATWVAGDTWRIAIMPCHNLTISKLRDRHAGYDN